MTTEEKARAYDEAIEKIKYVMGHGVQPVLNKEDLQDIFTELAESEDERISREITEFILTHRIDEPNDIEDTNAWLAWLEKQGKQEEPQVYETEDGKIITYSENEGYKVVEPKFHGGEWITNGIEIVQITGYDIDYGYQVDYKGNLQHRDTDIIEKDYHLWTIQDVEDGDVLANDNNIIILKELGYTWASDGNPENLYAYCGIKPDGNFKIEKENYCFCGLLHIHPATKEQRDLLFKKMKEAGYKWDAEKKKLRRFEQSIHCSHLCHL